MNSIFPGGQAEQMIFSSLVGYDIKPSAGGLSSLVTSLWPLPESHRSVEPVKGGASSRKSRPWCLPVNLTFKMLPSLMDKEALALVNH